MTSRIGLLNTTALRIKSDVSLWPGATRRPKLHNYLGIGNTKYGQPSNSGEIGKLAEWSRKIKSKKIRPPEVQQFFTFSCHHYDLQQAKSSAIAFTYTTKNGQKYFFRSADIGSQVSQPATTTANPVTKSGDDKNTLVLIAISVGGALLLVIIIVLGILVVSLLQCPAIEAGYIYTDEVHDNTRGQRDDCPLLKSFSLVRSSVSWSHQWETLQ